MTDSSASQNDPARNGRSLPGDLAAVLVATALVIAVAFAPGLRETPLRVPVGIAFVLFVPGYALVAALFPEGDRSVDTDSGDDPTGTTDDGTDRLRWFGNGNGIDVVDRFSLSIVLSAVIVPTIGLAMNYTPWGIRINPVVAAVSAVTVLVTIVAVYRRRAVVPAARFSVLGRESRARIRQSLIPRNTRSDAVLNGLLAIAVVLAVASVGFAVVAPGLSNDVSASSDDGFSAISLLDDDGDLLTNSSADDGTPDEFTVGIENNEQRTVTYTVVAVEQELATNESSDTVSVEGQRELERFETELAHGETGTIEHELEPADEATRLVWLLYPGDAPEEPTPSNADSYVTFSLDDDDG
ncbi:DUF1616 domain-containing protein [Natrinema zhouii]|uniref:DUF1616 domain-containing protein n=1 Tax=Natrinema zhouii TaxID=1710539 RepID=A0A7D6H6X7_9EURY|nr:DUF1616 domain-containing protein [Natrinema zhouii]QLK26368.1 DUF1616 domain-containing protein [Natrinema zhouii]